MREEHECGISMSILSGVLILMLLGWIPGPEPLAQIKSMFLPFTGVVCWSERA